MKCLICGRITLPGAKLCLDCKAARKRAFDFTVTQPLLAAAGAPRDATTTRRLLKPGQSVPDAARRAAKMALAARSQPNIATESPSRRDGRWPIIVGAMVMVVLALGYFGHFGANPSDTLDAVAVERAPREDRPPASPIVGALAPSAIVAPTNAAAAVPVTNSVAAVETAIVAPKADVAKRPNVRPRPEKAPIALPPPEPEPAPVIAVAPPPPPVVREAPPRDRWQLMSDAIARCPRDNFFSRVSCEQRLRLQYCDGHWGQVAQCASAPNTTDHGQ